MENKHQRILVNCKDKNCGHQQQIRIDSKTFICSVCHKENKNPAYETIFNKTLRIEDGWIKI